ncbi:tail fiber protein [Flexithrix dorotheae]|uniref:tail fiber protein n=1 Tax=Flexithrix dorotheae TaxID=70993 RepID=UPI0003738FA8|nr:tail fiber protein [Flexithrix dorotheae]
MKLKIFLFFLFFTITYITYSQTPIGTSEIYYSNNSTVIGNNGNILEPYSGYSSHNNRSFQIFGNTSNYGIPSLSFVKTSHSHNIGGSLQWLSDNISNTDKRFAQINGEIINGGGYINFSTRNESDPQGYFNSMVFNENGDLGIGTSTPNSKLHINNGQLKVVQGGVGDDFDATRIASFRGSNSHGNGWVEIWSDDSKQAGILFGNPTDKWQGRIHWDDAASHLAFYSGQEKRMTLTNQGKLKIEAPEGDNKVASIAVHGYGQNGAGTSNNVYLGGSFVSGTADGAEFDRYNIGIESWKGIGFKSTFNDKAGIIFNTRTASAFFEGKVGIGTDNPQNKLSVKGTIWAEKVKISLNDAADWVFEENYNLRPLSEVEAFIKTHKHLPDIPSADEFRQNDLDVAQMNNKLLQKIEELTLYMIEQDKTIKNQQKLIEMLIEKLK